MAAATFLLAARQHQATLDKHADKIRDLGLYEINQPVLFHPGLATWKHDGDALFAATLTPKRLASDYGVVDAHGARVATRLSGEPEPGGGGRPVYSVFGRLNQSATRLVRISVPPWDTNSSSRRA